jgi:hypothetical protein
MNNGTRVPENDSISTIRDQKAFLNNQPTVRPESMVVLFQHPVVQNVDERNIQTALDDANEWMDDPKV